MVDILKHLIFVGFKANFAEFTTIKNSLYRKYDKKPNITDFFSAINILSNFRCLVRPQANKLHLQLDKTVYCLEKPVLFVVLFSFKTTQA